MRLVDIIRFSEAFGKKTIINGLEYSIWKGKVIVYCVDKTITTAKIIQGTDIIQNNGFTFCDHMQELYIPESVTKIEDFAFVGCKCLKTVVLPHNLNDLGQQSFVSCSALESIVLPSDLRIIKKSMFSDCLSVKSIDFANVESINEKAFYNCRSLENLTIPWSVRYIGRNAFKGCSVLKEVIMPSRLSKYVKGAFESGVKFTYIESKKRYMELDKEC